MAHKRGLISEMGKDVLKNICVDYIVNELSRQEIADKYNITPGLCGAIVLKMDLVNRREKYRERVIEKALEKCSKYQAKIIADVTQMFAKHIDHMELARRIQDKKMLTHNQVKELVAIFSLIAKERRLDNDEPTSHVAATVKVELPEGMPVISKDQTIDVTPKKEEPKKIEKPPIKKETKTPHVKIDEDSVMPSIL